MDAAKGTRLGAYITLSLLTGLRTEEARALHWDHVAAWAGDQWQPVTEAGFDHEELAVFVWRSDRAGSDTKTPKSRRTLALAHRCVAALREQRTRQAADRLAAEPLWQDHNLVFASTVGTPLDDHNVRRQFRTITESAGLGSTWVPRELRHTFVSLLSAHGVPVEAIALLAGHNQTATTELVYRHQIVPALTRGAEYPAGVGHDPRPVSGHGDLRTAGGILHLESAFRTGADRSLDKPYSSSSKALFVSK
jgi:integrase